jgi:hypothetical protein
LTVVTGLLGFGVGYLLRLVSGVLPSVLGFESRVFDVRVFEAGGRVVAVNLIGGVAPLIMCVPFFVKVRGVDAFRLCIYFALVYLTQFVFHPYVYFLAYAGILSYEYARQVVSKEGNPYLIVSVNVAVYLWDLDAALWLILFYSGSGYMVIGALGLADGLMAMALLTCLTMLTFRLLPLNRRSVDSKIKGGCWSVG